MILVLLIPIAAFIYITIRQLHLYRLLRKSGLTPIFDIFGVKGFYWLNSHEAHKNFTEMCSTLNTKTYSMMKGSHPVVVTSDPELIHAISSTHYNCFHSRIQEILSDCPVSSKTIHMFAARGERWKRLRTLTSYGLSNAKLKDLHPTIEYSVGKFLNYFEELLIDDEVHVTDLHSLFQNHTSFVLIQCAYGPQDINHSDNSFLSVFKNAFGTDADKQFNGIEKIAFFFPELSSLLKSPIMNQFNNHIERKLFLDYLLSLINRFLQTSRETPDEKQDYSLLQYFYEHNNNNFDISQEKAYGEIDMKKVKVERAILTEEIAAQLKFLSVAGFDTTSNTLAALFYIFANNPDIQEELYRLEVQNAPDNVSFDDISNMKLLQCCIFECLRLFPHASPLQQRVCTQRCTIGDFEFHEGFEVVVNPWAPHMDPKIWGDDVKIFKPNRFENLTDAQKKAFMPFGVGPRQCAGMRFALLELKTTTFRMLQQYTVSTNSPQLDRNGAKLHMTVRDTGTLWPRDTLKLIFKRRTCNI
ncbi:unnamed protein product [Caenorhabditis bovis]|uniref:Cytochrome P450 n=1 Tax=Caenorhabditis bovis TaxID=2654633 RepID=A0A8S1EEX7_9PELO|nr:unnamed protein product [Caenorhabditis bovis]